MLLFIIFIILCVLLIIYYPKRIGNIDDYIIDYNDLAEEYNLIIKEISIIQSDLLEIPYMEINTHKRISDIIRKNNILATNFTKKAEELNNDINNNKIKKYRIKHEDLINIFDELKNNLNELYKIKPIAEDQYIKYKNIEKEKEQRKENKEKIIYKYFDGCNNKEEINKRYKALAKVYHPDMATGNENIFKIICEEYEKMIREK